MFVNCKHSIKNAGEAGTTISNSPFAVAPSSNIVIKRIDPADRESIVVCNSLEELENLYYKFKNSYGIDSVKFKELELSIYERV